jgi:hypothetical protein
MAVAAACLSAPQMQAKEKLPTAEQRFGGKIEDAENPSFRRHVVPLASKLGCSGRECHGSFQGRGGFQLSLFGYDFEKDHTAITNDTKDDIRVDMDDPAKSLFIQKPLKQIKHKGGEIYEEGSWEHNLMLKWIQQGAKLDVVETGEFGRLEIFPKEIVARKAGESIQLTVLAHWADGTVEDVTEFTRFRTNDESVVVAHEGGRIEIKGKGDSHVVAFYDNGVVPVPVMLPVSKLVGKDYPKVKTRTKVDALVIQKLRKVGLVPSETCTDTEFLRRVTLDVTGTLPTSDEIKKFLADKSKDKRTQKISQLLSRPAYAAWWATKLSDFTGNSPQQIRVNNLPRDTNLSGMWYDWIEHRVAKNVPYDKIVEGIVMGASRTSPDQTFEEMCEEMGSYFRDKNPKDFVDRETMPFFWARRNLRQPEAKAMAFAYSFLGVRIQCANCHKHPFDQWTQQDFKSFQAFFTPILAGANNRREGEGNMDYRTLTAELRKEANYDKNDPQQNLNRLLRPIIEKRLKAGEPIPWQEVYIRQRVQRKYTERQLEKLRKRNPNFNTRVITPRVLGGEDVLEAKYADPRMPLMEWLRAKENPYFARAFVNRVWAHYFGRGIVEPADDLNLANPPSNEALMDHLAKGFIASGYDMKWVHREIMNSDTYQRSWRVNDTNKLDEKNFSRYVIRRLPAEVVADSIMQATASDDRVEEFVTNMDTRMIGSASTTNYRGRNGAAYMLQLFGKPLRENNCDCERTSDPTLLQTIFTRNDPEMLARIEGSARGSSSWISELRKTHGANPRDRANAAKAMQMRRSLEGMRVRAKRYTANKPRKPQGDNPAQLKQFQARLKTYQKAVAKMRGTVAAYEKRITELTPRVVKMTPKEIGATIAEVFLRTVSRYPSPDELKSANADVAAASDPITGVRDLLWALLNTKEFIVNH